MTVQMKKMRDELEEKYIEYDCYAMDGNGPHRDSFKAGFDACYAIMQKRIKELEEHLGERNKAEIWSATNVILSEDW